MLLHGPLPKLLGSEDKRLLGIENRLLEILPEGKLHLKYRLGNNRFRRLLRVQAQTLDAALGIHQDIQLFQKLLRDTGKIPIEQRPPLSINHLRRGNDFPSVYFQKLPQFRAFRQIKDYLTQLQETHK